MEITAQLLSGLAGAFLSALLSIMNLWPRAGQWWEQFNDAQKQTINGVFVVSIALIIFALSCFNVIDWITCNESGLVSVVTSVAAALTGNTVFFRSFGKAIKKPKQQ